MIEAKTKIKPNSEDEKERVKNERTKRKRNDKRIKNPTALQ